jgi:hypothetical protein
MDSSVHIRGLSQGATRRVTASAPGQRAQYFSLLWGTIKKDEARAAMLELAGRVFRRPPSHRWRKG